MIRSALRSLSRPLRQLFRRREEREPPSHVFTPDEIGRLHRALPSTRAALDDQTWRDLLLDTYQDKLAHEVSIFGRQELHCRLRAGLDDDACAALRERLRALVADPDRLDALRTALRPLRHAEAETAGLLFEDAAPVIPWWPRFLWVLPLTLALSVPLLLTQPWGWLPAAGALAPLLALQVRHHRRMEAWGALLDSLNLLLAAAGTLGRLGGPMLESFASKRAAVARLHKRLAPSALGAMLPGAQSYLDWFGASNLRRHFRTRRAVSDAQALLRACFLACAGLEADVALARHLDTLDHWCWAERTPARTLELDQGMHPLMAAPSALSVALDGRGAFISGQNASGKSTLLRMVGINLVAAHAFGFCYAKQARLPAVPVRASMQNEDSLLGGESLYMSELRRAHDLVDAAGAPAGICLIDEIFRGTNHLESVSAAVAVLETIARRDLVLVSSHNLILARVLQDCLVPWRIDTEGGAPCLAPGVLRNPNGIALLASHGFGAEIERRAAEVAHWLADFMTQPGEMEPERAARDRAAAD